MAARLVAIATINVWKRLNVATRQVVGAVATVSGVLIVVRHAGRLTPS